MACTVPTPILSERLSPHKIIIFLSSPYHPCNADPERDAFSPGMESVGERTSLAVRFGHQKSGAWVPRKAWSETASGAIVSGWTAPYFVEMDEAAGGFIAKYMKPADLLLGRKTFDTFAAFWPTHADLWPGLNEVTKYVMSKTLDENKTDWPNVVFLQSVEDIKKLKNFRRL